MLREDHENKQTNSAERTNDADDDDDDDDDDDEVPIGGGGDEFGRVEVGHRAAVHARDHCVRNRLLSPHIDKHRQTSPHIDKHRQTLARQNNPTESLKPAKAIARRRIFATRHRDPLRRIAHTTSSRTHVNCKNATKNIRVFAPTARRACKKQQTERVAA